MAYADGQIRDLLSDIKTALTSTKDTHSVLSDVLIELQQLRIAVSEVMDVDLSVIDVNDYGPQSKEVGTDT